MGEMSRRPWLAGSATGPHGREVLMRGARARVHGRLRGTGELKVTEQVVYADMGALAVAQRRVVRAIGQALVELDIDRTALARE